jgi:glutamate formiminotransferase/formiminotetrahydrofolate cyclodeaminase
LVDEDTKAFNRIMQAFSLPKGTEEEKVIRQRAIMEATKNAIEVPFRVMQLALDSMEMLKAMAETGNPNSVSDAGVGALCARSAVLGAFLNVKINASGFDDKAWAAKVIGKGREMERSAIELESQILEIAEKKIGV